VGGGGAVAEQVVCEFSFLFSPRVASWREGLVAWSDLQAGGREVLRWGGLRGEWGVPPGTVWADLPGCAGGFRC